MTKLYRCRTSLRETSEHFGAQAPDRADWSAELWPGRVGLVVCNSPGGRRIHAMTWGSPRGSAGVLSARDERASTIWFRELFPDQPTWLDPRQRCLIVLDSFACPAGAAGERTRNWFGIEDRPIFGWAGIWMPTRWGNAYCGLLATTNELLAPGGAMPALVDPDEYEIWLQGDLTTAGRLARRTYPAELIYREETEEPWGGSR